jgi:flagellin
MASLYAQKNLSTAQASLSASVQRLSSGTRINSAKDDAAGYGIAESVKSTKNIVDQNIRNAKDGISWAQTAEGALDVVGKILQRAMTLATQKTDATLNSDQTASIDAELNALKAEVDNITIRTKFQGGGSALSVFGSNAIDAGKPVVKVSDAVAADAVTFTATGARFKAFTGASAGKAVAANDATTVIRAGSIAVDTGATTATTVTATMIDSTNIGSAGATVTTIQALITLNATSRGALGAALNSLEYAVDNMQTLSTNLADGISRIVDTDYAAETSNLTRSQILQQAATSMLAQANQMPNVILTLLK